MTKTPLIVSTLLLAASGAFGWIALTSFGLITPEEVAGAFVAQAHEAWAPLQGTPWKDYLVGGVAVLATLASLLAFSRTFQSRDGRSKQHVVDIDDTGAIVIDSETLETIALHTSLGTRGVLESEARVLRGRGPLAVRMLLGVRLSTDMKLAGQEVRRDVKHAIEHLAGVPVGSVIVRLELVPAHHYEALEI